MNGGLHVALIMDGNGRWAGARGLERSAGHRAGVESVRRVVRAAPALGIGTLSLYTFSCDNWLRPLNEVATLMQVIEDFLRADLERCRASGVRVRAFGRRDRLPERLLTALRAAESATALGARLDLRLAIDYSARDAILRAAEGMARDGADAAGRASTRDERQRFRDGLARASHEVEAAPDVDLLVRTGGERRLSDFLLWECAYAELYFTDTPWPDFDGGALAAALVDFRRRERRFGGLGEGRRASAGLPLE